MDTVNTLKNKNVIKLNNRKNRIHQRNKKILITMLKAKFENTATEYISEILLYLFEPKYCDTNMVAAIVTTLKVITNTFIIWFTFPMAATAFSETLLIIIWSTLFTRICSTSSINIGHVSINKDVFLSMLPVLSIVHPPFYIYMETPFHINIKRRKLNFPNHTYPLGHRLGCSLMGCTYLISY